MRLIDADALAERLGIKESCNDCQYDRLSFCGKASEFVDACDAIFTAPTVPQWIPVTERLPKRCRYYLVTDFGEVDEAYYGSDGRWFSDGNILKDVTAWMELPAPYKEA